MREIVKTNEPVLLSYVQALLSGAGITMTVADQNMSVMEGSIGILPRRVLVAAEMWDRARAVLVEAGLESSLSDDG